MAKLSEKQKTLEFVKVVLMGTIDEIKEKHQEVVEVVEGDEVKIVSWEDFKKEMWKKYSML